MDVSEATDYSSIMVGLAWPDPTQIGSGQMRLGETKCSCELSLNFAYCGKELLC